VLLEKNHAIQSAGMEDGLLDLVVIQLLVHMHNEQKLPDQPKPEPGRDLGWTMLDYTTPPYWGFDIYD